MWNEEKREDLRKTGQAMQLRRDAGQNRRELRPHGMRLANGSRNSVPCGGWGGASEGGLFLEKRQKEDWNENQLEGRNAVLEALRSGRDMENA